MNLLSSSSTNKKGILAKNTFINLAGKGIPLVFAIAAIPFVIKGLGTQRFGVLTIVWTVIGYFGLFDMGLGRATTKFVADFEAKEGGELSPIIITSLILLIGFGLVGGVVIVIATPYLVSRVLNVPPDLLHETKMAFYFLSASIPIVLGSTGARGVLEAQQRFGLVNAVKVPATIINYVGPLLILPFTNHLQYIVLLLVVERTISFGIFLYYSMHGQPLIKLSDYSFIKWTKKLLSFGAWLTVSNFLSPIMVYMDRFVIGALLTMSAVAYYTTPYEIVSRLGIISGSFMGVMFPAFSVYFLQDETKLASVYKKSIRYVLFALIPIIIFLIFAARPLLYYWLGLEFAIHSTVVLQILVLGIFINSIARVPSTVIQAGGRPDIRAKLHMVEVPIYLILLWYLTHWLGIKGVALAWLIRVSIDGAMLFYFSNRISMFKIEWSGLLSKIVITGVALLVGTLIFRSVDNALVTLFSSVICGVIALFVTWNYVLQGMERNQILNLMAQARSKVRRG